MSSKASLSKEKLAELVKCVLCMKTCTSPQTLKCFHTFCKQCLDNNAKRSSVDDVQGLECPRCKQFTAQSDVTACTRTERLLKLHYRVTQSKICFQCETEPSEWHCQDCDEYYCCACKEMHLKIKQFVDHTFVGIEYVKDDIPLTGKANCKKHAEKEAECFCFDCDLLLCTLCLIQGHGTHRRDTIKNAVDDVKTKVNEKLATVKQISNERFLRAEKLKGTRLLIQTYADESLDDIKSRYKFLKQKLEEDYLCLIDKLKTSVDAELEKVNAAIVAEEAKQSHATAVTSYVENTLGTNCGAMLIRECTETLLPSMQEFHKAEGDLEPPLTPSIHRFRNSKYFKKSKTNMMGSIETINAGFHGRYRHDLTKEMLNSATVGKTIDINLEREAKGYRIDVGYGKILVCFWSINVILVYDSDGTEFRRLDLSGKLVQPWSAVFVDASHIMVATTDGLALIDHTTSNVDCYIGTHRYSDVCVCNGIIKALNVSKHRIDTIRKTGRNWTVDGSVSLTAYGSHVSNCSTAVGLPNCIKFCNLDNNVLMFNLTDKVVQTVVVKEQEPRHEERRTDKLLCAADTDGRMVLSLGGQLVLQYNDQNEVLDLDGMTGFFDLVFEDQHTFWTLNYINLDQGQYRLIKYSM